YESLIQEQIPIYAESSEELYTWEELQTLLRQALDKLPENYRLAFEKNRFENKSYGEIAEEMQISIRTVERYKNKATELLKTELKDYLPLFIGWLF
ncbi:MAG: sigma-70 family RNA polymerase sigma factor, partial [Parabacteroides distasonis]